MGWVRIWVDGSVNRPYRNNGETMFSFSRQAIAFNLFFIFYLLVGRRPMLLVRRGRERKRSEEMGEGLS